MKHIAPDFLPFFDAPSAAPKLNDGRGLHTNSRAAYHALNVTARQRAVLEALDAIGRPATDKDVMRRMGSVDPNVARPRVSECVKAGILEEVGKVKDEESGCTVRLVWFAEGEA